jgi:hypothetical protein
MKHFKCVLIAVIFFTFFVLPKDSLAAIRFTLEAPSGQLTQGQEVSFIINIDTQGASVNTASLQANYDPNYLEFVAVRPGNTFSQITATPLSNTDGGKRWLLISASNPTNFTGSGIFAYYVLRIIAQSSGSTEICDITEVSPTPAPQNTYAPQPTTPPGTPRAPTSGNFGSGSQAVFIGGIFIVLAAVFYAVNANSHLIYPKNETPVKKNK